MKIKGIYREDTPLKNEAFDPGLQSSDPNVVDIQSLTSLNIPLVKPTLLKGIHIPVQN